jgi:hypothetical protein
MTYLFTKEMRSEKILVISNLRDKYITYLIAAAFENRKWKEHL